MEENNKWDRYRYFKEAGVENTNKYGENNPYYKPEDEDSFVTKLSDEEKKINDKRIMDLEMKGKIEKRDIIMDDMESITPRPGQTFPTQEEIIAYNRMQSKKQEEKSTTVVVERSFLEKLKDFEYWKEWKNQG